MTAPMFKVFTGAMEPYTKDVGGITRKFIKTTASSTVTDRKGHEFDTKALQKMGAAAQGMTIFLNHSYEVPEDLFGTIAESATKQAGFDSDNNAIWDLGFDVMINEANPRAVQAWDAYNQGVKMGVSVGVLIKEWEKKAKDSDIMVIKDVEFLEASIVGIPANPRTWVHSALKSINSWHEEKRLEAEGVTTLSTGPDSLLDAVDDPIETNSDSGVPEAPAPEAQPEKVPEAAAPKEQPEQAPEATAPVPPETDDALSGQEEAKSVTDDANTDAAEELSADSDPEASAEGATQSAPDGEAVDRPGASVVASIDLLVNAYQAQVQDLTSQLGTITKERDEAREAARLAMSIVERISVLPLGRKATYQREITSFRRDLAGVYGDDFLAFLEGEPSK